MREGARVRKGGERQVKALRKGRHEIQQPRPRSYEFG